MTGTNVPNIRMLRLTRRALQVRDNLLDLKAHQVKQEIFCHVFELNQIFLSCQSLEEQEELAKELYKSSTSIVKVIGDLLMEGNPLSHLLLQLLLNLSYDPLAEEQMIEHEILQTLLRTIRLADAITQSIAFELIVKFTSEVNSRAMNIFMKQNNFRVFLRLIQNPDDDTSPLRIPRCLDCILLLIHRVTYHFQGPSLFQANLQVIQPAMSLLEACVVKYEEKTKTNSSIPKDNKKSNGLRNRLVRTQERLERILR